MSEFKYVHKAGSKVKHIVNNNSDKTLCNLSTEEQNIYPSTPSENSYRLPVCSKCIRKL